ncbi:MAG: rRNA maturation RNase YbeY [Candidatus Woykebacteria bacterium RIFCSPHIGHO2_12_FULL_45_10]|uniref:Endoribonuclease YbeY n=1 Tax=Candidatus Woykebacteria bacterium RIFCSPHIGHO2_12_FULL_45_10 TaxID=1802603 RepID=A0A1G1WR19_9BACT|nr:MAG: rRNA maturation RNase YbeY [Candidatus Woykebacteria bacterium RIFCSPHIGHO2_12_FULL_45_10]
MANGEVRGEATLTISIIGDRKMRALNKEYRGIDSPTDVLAFPYAFGEGKVKFVDSDDPNVLNLGDIVISYPQLLARAAKEDTLVDEMAAFLVIHGVLHLLGYDHEKDNDAAKMEPLEDKILSNLYPALEVIK